MNVVIAGGGRTGTQLAILLMRQQHTITLIEHRPAVLSRIHKELPTEAIIEGNPTNQEVLRQAGITEAHALAACSDIDEENLAICYLARTVFNVPRTIARINNPRNGWLFDEKFHVDVAINAAEIMSSLIEEEISLGDMMTLLKIRRGEYSLVEEKIPPGARAVGMEIKNLALPEECVIAAIIRHGKVVLPRGNTTFESGDEVLAITDREGADELIKLFSRAPD
jgi:trk system potassium uptake protein TrkA